jgi:hypothetical protein
MFVQPIECQGQADELRPRTRWRALRQTGHRTHTGYCALGKFVFFGKLPGQRPAGDIGGGPPARVEASFQQAEAAERIILKQQQRRMSSRFSGFGNESNRKARRTQQRC